MPTPEVISSIINNTVEERATQLNPYNEQPRELAIEAALEERERTGSIDLFEWRHTYEAILRQLEKEFAGYDPDVIKIKKGYDQKNANFNHYAPEIDEELEQMENPVIAALYQWASHSEKEPLLRMVKKYPELAGKEERLTQWLYYSKALETGEPYLKVYRAVDQNLLELGLRPFESITLNRKFAKRWCVKGMGRVLVEYHVPIENLFASFETTRPLENLSGRDGENEIMLNARGKKNVTIAKVLKPEDLEIESKQTVISLVEQAKVAGITSEAFIRSSEVNALLQSVSTEAREQFVAYVEENLGKRRLLDSLSQIGKPKGTNAGGVYKDFNTDETFYVKTYPERTQAACEWISNELYRKLGVPVLQGELITNGESLAYGAPYVETLRPADSATREQISRYFVPICFLLDWDAVGTGPESPYGNLMMKEEGNIVLIDHGGSLLYRGLHGTKDSSSLISDSIPEINTMRSDINPLSKKLFKDVTDNEINQQALELLAKVGEADIIKIVNNSDVGNISDKDKIIKLLLGRRRWLEKHYEQEQ